MPTSNFDSNNSFDHHRSTSTSAPATTAPPQTTTTIAATTTTTTTEARDADTSRAPGMFFLSLFSYPTNSYLQPDYVYGTRTVNTTTMPGTTISDGHSHNGGIFQFFFFFCLLAFKRGLRWPPPPPPP